MCLRSRFIHVILASSALALFTGCESTKTKEAKAPDEEYVYVTETGSRIPTKVKKSKGKSDSTNSESGDAKTLEQLQRDQTQRTMMRDGR